MGIIILVCVITLAVEAFLAARTKKDISSELISRAPIQAIKDLRADFYPEIKYSRDWIPQICLSTKF